jgi:hypothetical protein
MSIQAPLRKAPAAAQAPPTLASVVPFHEFLSLDIRSLALFRICLALCLLSDWVDRLPDLTAHYSDQGIVPRNMLGGLCPPILHCYSGETWFQAVLAGLGIVLALALMVGRQTPLATFFSWLLLISVHGRNPALMQGGDMLLRLLVFWGLFLPLGACYSLDAADPNARPRSPRVLSPGSVALVLQICLVYWFAGAWKWAPEWHEEGSAVHLALQIDYFTTRFGQFLLQYSTVCRLLTWSTILLETIGPVMLFLPFAPGLFRMLTIGAFLTFHTGLAATMELGNFPFVCMVAWLALLPTSFWDRIVAQLRTPARVGTTLVHDPLSTGGRRLVGLLETFLLIPGIRLAEAVEAGGQRARVRARGGWGVIDSAGVESYQVQALARLVSLSPIFAPLAFFLRFRVVEAVAGRILSLLSAGRGKSARQATPAWAPPGGPLVNTVVVLLLVYIILWNVQWIDPERNSYLLPQQMQGLGTVLSLEQGWGLFAPFPGKVHGWVYVVGKRKDGEEIFLPLEPGMPPLTDHKPPLLSAAFSNGRWRKLIMNVCATGAYPNLAPSYAHYLLQEWNRHHEGNEQLSSLEMYWMKEEGVPPGQERPAPVKIRLFPPPAPEGKQ